MKSKVYRGFAWVIMGLVLVGLIGFGRYSFGHSAGSIGKVGATEISANRYFREMRSTIRAFESQTGQKITFAQAQGFGLDSQVLARLLSSAAMEDEVARLGISVGDKEVAKRVEDIGAFQGLDGKFSREAYNYALKQSGLTVKEFEGDLRSEVARTILQRAVSDGVTPPPIYAETLYGWAREARDFTWAALGPDVLDTPVGQPDNAALKAYYDAHHDAFTLPATKQISYILVTPDDVLGQIDVPEDALKALYEQNADKYHVPERRLVERLVFPDQATADDAARRLADGSSSFEALVQERGLQLSDIDMGDVTQGDLSQAAGKAVFASDGPGVVGPVMSDLGPALFRVNAVLPAETTTFEQAKPELKREYATDQARGLLSDRMSTYDDALAGGATLEDLAKDQGLKLQHIDYVSGSTDGPAAYDGFRKAADKVTADDYPQMAQLDDGAIFALRLDGTTEPRLQTLDEVHDKAVAGWQAEETQRRVEAKAHDMLEKINEGESPASLGLTETVETDQERSAYIDGAPATLVKEVFQMDPAEWRVVPSKDGAVIVRLDKITPPDLTTPEAQSALTTFAEQRGKDIGTDIENAFAQALEDKVGITLDRNMINAVNANFP